MSNHGKVDFDALEKRILAGEVSNAKMHGEGVAQSIQGLLEQLRDYKKGAAFFRSAYFESQEELEAAKQRELELLAVIDEQNKFLDRCLDEEFGISNKYLRKEIEERYITPMQLLREHEAKVLEDAADWFDDLEEYSIANKLRRMAEERRKQ